MSKIKKINIEELKLFLISLLEERKLNKNIDLNKAICDKFRIILCSKEDTTLVGLYGEDMYEMANGRMSIEDIFEGELIEDCSKEFNLRLKSNNDCCSFNYAKLILGDNTYLIPIHSLINSNYTNDVCLNFNGLVLEEELLNNFPLGRRLGYYYNTTMLKHMVDIKEYLGNNESLNYYIRNKCNIKGVDKEFNISDIPNYLGHSILDYEDCIEIKDYDNNKFVINKISSIKIDFDTIKMIG